jgi:hypothetical protein
MTKVKNKIKEKKKKGKPQVKKETIRDLDSREDVKGGQTLYCGGRLPPTKAC